MMEVHQGARLPGRWRESFARRQRDPSAPARFSVLERTGTGLAVAAAVVLAGAALADLAWRPGGPLALRILFGVLLPIAYLANYGLGLRRVRARKEFRWVGRVLLLPSLLHLASLLFLGCVLLWPLISREPLRGGLSDFRDFVVTAAILGTFFAWVCPLLLLIFARGAAVLTLATLLGATMLGFLLASAVRGALQTFYR